MFDMVLSYKDKNGNDVYNFTINTIDFEVRKEYGPVNVMTIPLENGGNTECYKSNDDALITLSRVFSKNDENPMEGITVEEKDIWYYSLYVKNIPSLKDKLCGILTTNDFLSYMHSRVFSAIINSYVVEAFYYETNPVTEENMLEKYASFPIDLHEKEMNIELVRKRKEQEYEDEIAKKDKMEYLIDKPYFDDLVKLVKSKKKNHDWKNINNSAKLKNGGRKAQVIDEDSLMNVIVNYLSTAMAKDGYSKEEIKIEILDDNYACINNLINYLPSIMKQDLSKVDFDTENIDIDEFGSTKDGVSYILCRAGGDWEVPIYFAVYYDGSSLRGYIPVRGNTYNYISNEAFGTSDEEADAKFLCKELGINYTLKCRHEDFLEEVGTDFIENIEPDYSRMIEDINSRLEPILDLEDNKIKTLIK